MISIAFAPCDLCAAPSSERECGCGKHLCCCCVDLHRQECGEQIGIQGKRDYGYHQRHPRGVTHYRRETNGT